MSTRFTRTMKLSRKVLMSAVAVALALVCVVLTCFASVNPDEYNLVPYDASTWTPYCDNGVISTTTWNGDMISIYNSNAVANVGTQYISVCLQTAIPSGFLVPGQAYSISFTYPSDQEIRTFANRTQSYIDSNWNRVVVAVIGLAQILEDGSYQMLEGCSVQFDHSDSVQYTGKTNYINFTMPETSGKQVVFVVGYLRGGSSSQNNPTIYFGRYYGLFDFERKKEIEAFNRIWYGNAEGDYSNPYTTENYDVGDASDLDRVDDVFDRWEDGIDAVFRPIRVAGVFSNAIFSPSAIAWGATLVFLLLSLAFLFRLMGVT